MSSSVPDTNDPVDFADFASRNEDRIAPETVGMLEPTDLVQLPKGEALALIHGSQLHEIGMPLPLAASDPLMLAGLAAIGTTRRARPDGPWNRLDEGAEAEERRVVQERGVLRRGAGGCAAQPVEAGLVVGAGVGRASPVRLDS